VIKRLTFDEHIGGVGLLGRTVGGLAADGDRAGVDPIAGFTAGAVTEVGEELVETAHDSKRWGAAAARGMFKTCRGAIRPQRFEINGG
jgi:hypothetical protein